MDTPILSLYELNNLVRGILSQSFDHLFWIRAEMSDVRMNQNGHCYLEFLEKDSSNRTIIARARGSIWSNVFRLVKPYFESETGQSFASGLKVLVQVSVEFHELYGYSLNVHDIDPSYTLGDQARNRAMILKQLEEEGVLTLNRELEFPDLPQRIAVISSPTAAGYEDFCNQLEHNSDGFAFYTHLFPAVMQGERTESSIIAALDRICGVRDLFDVVVIIRGGGATSELSSFDSYLLATNCAQFPLPIITGIGHERDDTVLDMVAHTRAKTPTAVAEFLIKRLQYIATNLFDLQGGIIISAQNNLKQKEKQLENLVTRFSYLTKDRTKDQLRQLDTYKEKLRTYSEKILTSQSTYLSTLLPRMSYPVVHFLQEEKHRLNSATQYIELASPENILKKGYTLTLRGKQIIKRAGEVKKGEVLTTRFFDGDTKIEIK